MEAIIVLSVLSALGLGVIAYVLLTKKKQNLSY